MWVYVSASTVEYFLGTSFFLALPSEMPCCEVGDKGGKGMDRV